MTPTSGPLDPARVRELSARSTLRGAAQLTAHMVLLGLTSIGLWSWWGTLWAAPLWIGQGVLINYLYAAQHELSHGTVFASRAANEWWGRVFGFVNLFPRDYDRHHHLRHHRYTGDPEQDAELAFRAPYTFTSYSLYLLGVTYWFGRAHTIVSCAVRRFGAYPLSPAVASTLAREARIHLALYAAIAAASVITGSWAAVVLWLGPMITMKATHQLQNTIEHTGMQQVPELLLSTRTVHAPRWWRWLGWNMAFHTAHHAYPSVPFFRLPQLHNEVVAAAGAPVTATYLGFQRDILRALWRQPERP